MLGGNNYYLASLLPFSSYLPSPSKCLKCSPAQWYHTICCGLVFDAVYVEIANDNVMLGYEALESSVCEPLHCLDITSRLIRIG